MKTPRPATAASTPTRAGALVILSRFELVSQAVAAALRGCAVEAHQMAWESGVRRAVGQLTATDTVLLLDDLEDRDAVMATRDLVGQSAARFLVLTDCPAGPAWGALLEAGAAAVMSARSTLEEVRAALDLISEGRTPMPETTRSGLMHDWLDLLADDTWLQARTLLPSDLSGTAVPRPRDPGE